RSTAGAVAGNGSALQQQLPYGRVAVTDQLDAVRMHAVSCEFSARSEDAGCGKGALEVVDQAAQAQLSDERPAEVRGDAADAGQVEEGEERVVSQGGDGQIRRGIHERRFVGTAGPAEDAAHGIRTARERQEAVSGERHGDTFDHAVSGVFLDFQQVKRVVTFRVGQRVFLSGVFL